MFSQPLGNFIADLLMSPMDLLHDAITFLLIADNSRRTGTNFGYTLQQDLQNGVVTRFTDRLLAVSSSLGSLIGIASPQFGCFVSGAMDIAIRTLQTIVQIVADSSKHIPSGQKYGQQFVESYGLGRYSPVIDAVKNISLCLEEVGDIVFPDFGCLLSNLYLVPVGLLEDMVAFCIVVTRAAVFGTGFATEFSTAWNMGSMSNMANSIISVSYCMSGLLDLVDERLTCFVGAAIKLVGVCFNVVFQFIVDVFFTNSFEANWSAGAYSYVSDAESDLFDCLGNLFGIIDSDLGCILQTLLTYISAFARDVVDFALAFARSVNRDTNFGYELDVTLQSGGLNATFANTETLSMCANDLGTFSGGPSFTCLIGSIIKIVNRFLSIVFLVVVEAIRSDGSYSAYYSIAYATWSSGRFDAFFSSVTDLGACLGGTLSRISPYIGCFISFSVNFIVQVVKTAVQMGFDSFNPSGSTFEQQWYAGAYSGLFSAEEAFFTCFSSPVALLDDNIACLVYNAMDYLVSLGEDIIDFVLVFKKSIDSDDNFGDVLDAALDNGRINATYTTTAAFGECLVGVGPSQIACVVETLTLLVGDIVIVLLRLVAKFFKIGRDGLYTPFNVLWQEGVIQRTFGEFDAFGACLASVLGYISPHFPCLISTLFTLVTSILTDVIQVLLASSKSIYIDGQPMWFGIKESWDAGNLSATPDAIDGFMLCLEGLLDETIPGIGCTLRYIVSSVVYTFRNLIYACLIMACSTSYEDFSGTLLSAWDNGDFETAFDDLNSLAGCLADLLSIFSPTVACLLSQLTIGLVRAVIRDAGRLLVLAAASLNTGGTTLPASIMADWTNSTNENLNTIYILVRTTLPACIESNPGSSPRQIQCLIATSLSLIASTIKSIGMMLVSTASTLLTTGNPVDGFCNYWDGTAYDDFFSDAPAFTQCLGTIFALVYPTASCLPPVTLNIITAGIKDAGQLVCTLDGASRPLSFQSLSEAFVNGWRAGLYHNALNKISASGACPASMFSRSFSGFSCTLTAITAFFAVFLETCVEVLTIAVSVIIPISPPVPGIADYAENRILLSVVNGWTSGRLKQLPTSFTTLLLCVVSIPSLIGADAACTVRGLINLINYAVLSAGDFVAAIATSLAQSSSFATAFITVWDTSTSVSSFGSTFTSTMSCFSTFLSRFTSDLGCILPNVLTVVQTLASAIIQMFVVIMRASTGQVNFISEFDNEWVAGVFQPVFTSLTSLANCVANVASRINSNLSSAIDSIFLMLIKFVQAIVTFFVYVGQANGVPSGVITLVFATLDTYPVTFMDAVFQQATNFSKAIGMFFGLVESDFGGIVSNLLCMIVELFRGSYRFTVIISNGLLADGGAAAALNNFKAAWRQNDNGGSFSAIFTYWSSLAANTGNIFGYIHSSLACTVSALVYLPAHLFLFAVGLVLCFTDPNPIESMQAYWSFLFVPHLFTPLLGVANCLSEILSAIDSALGCAAGSLLTVAVDFVEFVLSIFVFFNIIFIDGYGITNVVDSTTVFNSVTAIGTCIQGFAYSLAGSCSSLNFFCKLGDCVYDVFALFSALARKILVVIPDSIITGGGFSDAVNFQDIITLAETLLSDLSLTVASLIPFPSTSYCDQSTWATYIGTLIFHAVDIVMIPAKLVNLFLTSAFGGSTSLGSFISSLLNVFFSVAINILNDFGNITSCLTGSGSFFTTLANILQGLLSVFSGTALAIITDLLTILVDLFTGNFSGFGDALGQLLVDFGDFFSSIATQIIDAIIPGGTAVFDTILNFFTGPACSATESAINAMVDAINALIGVVRCLGCLSVSTSTQCVPCGSCLTGQSGYTIGCSPGLCGGYSCAILSSVTTSVCGTCGINSVSYVSICSSKRSKGSEGFSTEGQSHRAYRGDAGNSSNPQGSSFASSSFYNSDILFDYMTYNGEFGSEVNDTDIMSIIQSIVPWNGGSMCDVVINGFQGTSWVDIGLSDRAFMSECMQKRFGAIKLGLAMGWFTIPQDLFYNWMRPFSIVKDITVGTAIYAKCLTSNATCAYDAQDLATALEAVGVDYSVVLYVLGMGEKAVEGVLNYAQVKNLVQKLGAQSSIGSLIYNVNQLLVGSSAVIINNTLSNGDLIGSMYNDIAALTSLYSQTVGNETQKRRSIFAEVANETEKGFSRRSANKKNGIGMAAYTSELYYGLKAALSNIMDPNGGHVRTLFDIVFIGGRDTCDMKNSNSTQCPAVGPTFDAEMYLQRMSDDITSAGAELNKISMASRDTVTQTIHNTTKGISLAVDYALTLPSLVGKMRDDMLQSISALGLRINGTLDVISPGIHLSNSTYSPLKRKLDNTLQEVMKNITDSANAISTNVDMALASLKNNVMQGEGSQQRADDIEQTKRTETWELEQTTNGTLYLVCMPIERDLAADTPPQTPYLLDTSVRGKSTQLSMSTTRVKERTQPFDFSRFYAVEAVLLVKKDAMEDLIHKACIPTATQATDRRDSQEENIQLRIPSLRKEKAAEQKDTNYPGFKVVPHKGNERAADYTNKHHPPYYMSSPSPTSIGLVKFLSGYKSAVTDIVRGRVHFNYNIGPSNNSNNGTNSTDFTLEIRPAPRRGDIPNYMELSRVNGVPLTKAIIHELTSSDPRKKDMFSANGRTPSHITSAEGGELSVTTSNRTPPMSPWPSKRIDYSYPVKKMRSIYDTFVKTNINKHVPKGEVVFGCLPGALVCTDCLIADSMFNEIIDALEDTVYYYGTVYVSASVDFSSYYEILETRGSDPSRLFAVWYTFPGDFFTGFFIDPWKEALEQDDSSQSNGFGFSVGGGGGDGNFQASQEVDEVKDTIVSTNGRSITSPMFAIYLISVYLPDLLKDAGYALAGLVGKGGVDIGPGDSGVISEAFDAAYKIRNVILFYANTILTCNERNQYTCEDRYMSFGQGVFATTAIAMGALGGILLLSTVFSSATVIIVPAVLLIPNTFMFITYSTSPFCALPPTCILGDAVDFMRDTLAPPCIGWWGMIIPNSYSNISGYTSDSPSGSCPSCGSPSSMLDCSGDLGFSNPFNTFVYIMRVLTVKQMLWPLDLVAPEKWNEIDPNKHLYDYLQEVPILNIIFTSDYALEAYKQMSMVPGTNPSGNPQTSAYIDSLLSPDGSTVPPVYHACAAVTFLNVIPYALLFGGSPILFGLISAAFCLLLAIPLLLWGLFMVVVFVVGQMQVFAANHTAYMVAGEDYYPREYENIDSYDAPGGSSGSTRKKKKPKDENSNTSTEDSGELYKLDHDSHSTTAHGHVTHNIAKRGHEAKPKHNKTTTDKGHAKHTQPHTKAVTHDHTAHAHKPQHPTTHHEHTATTHHTQHTSASHPHQHPTSTTHPRATHTHSGTTKRKH